MTPLLLPTLALTLAAFLLRLAALAHTLVVARDGITYLELAGLLTRGHTAEALASHYPPGYPALLALGTWPWGPTELAAGVVTAAAGSLLVPAVVALGVQAGGARAGLWAGALAALLPLHVELGAEVLADAPHLAALAWLLLCLTRLQAGARPWAWALGAALCGGLGYLIRPESLVVLGAGALGLLLLPRPAPYGGAAPRLRALAWLALPAALALIPYLLRIRDEPVLGGEAGAGLLKLTKKQNLPQLLDALSPGLLGARALDLTRRTLQAGLPLLPGLIALAIWRRPHLPSRRLAAQLAWLSAWLLAAFVVVRADRRFAAQLALFALPHAGLGFARLARRLRGPRATRALIGALIVACVPYALRDRRAAKRSLREAGAVLAGLDARRVLAHDSRSAFYAGATPITPLAWFDPSRPPPDAAELLKWAQAQDADALVLEVQSPAEQAVSAAVARALERTPTQVRLPEAVPLDVYPLR